MSAAVWSFLVAAWWGLPPWFTDNLYKRGHWGMVKKHGRFSQLCYQPGFCFHACKNTKGTACVAKRVRGTCSTQLGVEWSSCNEQSGTRDEQSVTLREARLG